MKNFMTFIRVTMLLAFFSLSVSWGQDATPVSGKPMVYENHNQTDYPALVLRGLAGAVHDEQGVPIPGVSFGVFTEADHRLIATFKSTSGGSFEFRHLPPGQYRVIAKYDGFCSANIPISISKRASAERGVDVHMKPAGIDSCSYGTLSRMP